MKVKITQEHLEKLEILNKLRLQRNILDTCKEHDLEQLAARLTCDSALLIEVLESMGIEIWE